MNNIRVLDVTLRDGGCVNNFNFGQVYIDQILKAQEKAGLDIIELGYIDEKNGSKCGRTQYINEKVISEYVLKQKKEGVTYVAMMDYGKFNPDNLSNRSSTSIDGIRVAFHKKDMYNMIAVCKTVMSKGYQAYIQPMITLRYSDEELLELINIVNSELSNASGFYIVDTFGEMRPNDMSRIMNLVDHNLISSMPMGFHSHNNIQMSYSNACAMLNFPTKRNLMIDSSIMGMGKGAGNLNTELLLEHLNVFHGTNYNISPLLEVMDKVINQLHSEFYWGYAPEYYLSSANHCTPSYASHFYNKHQLPIDQVAELLGLIDENKRISFDKEYAEELWRKYNESKQVDDSVVLSEMSMMVRDKTVLLVAPGKSILSHKNQIEQFIDDKNIISFGLNLTEKFSVNYEMITRKDLFESTLEDGKNVITTSNVSKGVRGPVKILNYKNWIEIDNDGTHDTSSVILINFLKACGVKNIYLAGFDGFYVNVNMNYSDPNLRRPVTVEQVDERNKYYKSFFRKIQTAGIGIKFITPSLYE
jgi:4-hydroxy 2-oxovalerate aldolase